MSLQIFISYARANEEAVRGYQAKLERIGYTVWRDTEALRGGMAWRKQLHQAIQRSDVVLLFLTPSAVASDNVTLEWQKAQDMEKPLLPLLLEACDVPSELQPVQYHRLDQPQALGWEGVLRDLRELEDRLNPPPAEPKPPESPASKYTIGNANNSAVGDNPTVFNVEKWTTINVADRGVYVEGDVGGSVRTGDDNRSEQPPRPVPSTPWVSLGEDRVQEIVAILEQSITMQTSNGREDVVATLSADIRGNIHRRYTMRADLLNIVKTCNHYPDGVAQLVASLEKLEGASFTVQRLRNLLLLK